MEADAPGDSGAPARGGPLALVGPGAPLSGWIAALDRETRGFARPRDWGRCAEGGRLVSLKRGGRPVALGAWQEGASGSATPLGPIAAKTPEAASDLFSLLAARSSGKRLSLALPEEARMLLLAAGALRRYGGGGGRFF
jgi:hypothetical protein